MAAREPAPDRPLSDACQRALVRIAQHMRDGASVEIRLTLHQGGVRELLETRRVERDDAA